MTIYHQKIRTACRGDERCHRRQPTWILAALWFLVPGCAAGPGTVALAPEDTTDIVWPLPPDTPRVRYLGMVHSAADIGGRSSFLGGISRALTGVPDAGVALIRPFDVYAPDSTRIYVTDTETRQLAMFDLRAQRATVLGASGPGVLFKPMGLGGDGRGGVLVTDPARGRVVAFDSTGRFTGAFGGPDILLNPVDVAADRFAGRIYVVDSYLHQVVVFAEDGAVVDRLGRQVESAATKRRDVETPGWNGTRDAIRNRGPRPGEFLFPVSIAVADDGTVYVCDGMNARVQVFSRAGEVLQTFGEMGRAPGQFARPKGIAVDTEGHVYVTDAAFNNVQIFDREGRILLNVGAFGVRGGEFRTPHGAYVDGQNRVYISDRFNQRIQIFQYLPSPSAEIVVAPKFRNQ